MGVVREPEGTSEKAMASWCGWAALDIGRPGDFRPPEGAWKAGSCIPVFCDWKGVALLGRCLGTVSFLEEEGLEESKAGDGAGEGGIVKVCFQADILSSKAQSRAETLRADGDSSPERGRGAIPTEQARADWGAGF